MKAEMNELELRPRVPVVCIPAVDALTRGGAD